jgi:hypothetical protein
MTPDESLRFLATLGIEYAQDYARAGKPATQQALLSRIETASVALREALGLPGGPDGSPPD